MNISKQAEVDQLFKKINKRIHESNRSPTEDELNKVRAIVVQSQRPLQSVRLLQKEREERATDESFQAQKEQIIKEAKELDLKRSKYKKD